MTRKRVAHVLGKFYGSAFQVVDYVPAIHRRLRPQQPIGDTADEKEPGLARALCRRLQDAKFTPSRISLMSKLGMDPCRPKLGGLVAETAPSS